MSTTRSVMDAVNIDTNEKIYFNSYAPATYMADGRSAENAINSLDSKLTNAIVEINSHFSSIEEDINDLNIDLGTKQDIIEDLIDIRTAAYFNEGVNAVTSLSSIPVTKRLCIITVSASGSLTLNSTPAAGREIHTIINNNGTSPISVALPNTGNYICMTDNALSIDAGAYVEVNIISDGNKMYIRGNK